MSLLTPWFLAGLAALAVPVLIHLINRERKTVVEFPSLMFLQRIPYRSVRRQKLRHLLLLALRCLALFFLVAAFSRPFFEHKNALAGGGTGARERVVLLDHSYSMGYGDRWKRALDAARAATGDLSGSDRATLVLFANEAAAVTEPTPRRDVLERAIAGAQLSDEGTRIAPAVKLASQLLEGSNLPRREVVIISDFQRLAWQQRDEVRLPPRTTVRVVDLSGGETPDLAVTTVKTDRDAQGERSQVTVAARITNTGKSPRTTDATLELGGRAIATQQITVPASGSAQVRFAATAVPLGATRGAVRIPRDALAANNAFHFTIAPDEAVSVLVLEPTLARANQSLFLARALAIGDRPVFQVDTKAVDLATVADLHGRSLIVLNDVAPPGGAVGAKIREMVNAGTGLLIAPGDVIASRWTPDWQPYLPVKLGGVTDRATTGGGTLTSVNYSSPVFELFASPHNGDFSTARVYRYRALGVTGDSGVLARFDDGTPALVERTVGRGKVMVWGSSFDEYWTDLPVQPVFLPFVHELAKYAGRFSDARQWFTAGDALDLTRHGELTAGFAAAPKIGESDLILEAPSHKRVRLSAGGADHIAPLTEAGFYELRGAATPVGSGRPIAVIVDPAVSDLAPMAPTELVAAITAPGPTANTGLTSDGIPDETERKQTLWWYLLFAAMLLVAGETMLSNRLSRAEG
jgi:hypothetical protein